jgi:hypothetical protein
MNMAALDRSGGQTTTSTRRVVHNRDQASAELQGDPTRLGALARAVGDPSRGQTRVTEVQQTFHRVSA